MTATTTEYVIEFRSGTYFVDADSRRGGPLAHAFRFPTEAAAMEVAGQYALAGAMVVPIKGRR